MCIYIYIYIYIYTLHIMRNPIGWLRLGCLEIHEHNFKYAK